MRRSISSIVGVLSQYHVSHSDEDTTNIHHLEEGFCPFRLRLQSPNASLTVLSIPVPSGGCVKRCIACSHRYTDVPYVTTVKSEPVVKISARPRGRM